jgi:large subunit ribosomal protein L21
MYAVIKTGGKQYKVTEGDVLEVEHIRLKGEETTTDLTPILVVTDEGKAIHGAKELAGYKVGVKMLGDAKGDKVTVFKYRPKSGYASKTGHRQLYSLIEITSIGDQSPAKAQKSSAKAARKASDKAADKATDKAAEKATDKDAAKAAEKASDKTAEKASDETAVKAADLKAANLDADGS